MKSVVMFVLVILTTGVCFGLNRGDILNQVRWMLDDKIATNIKHKWTNEVLIQRINLAHLDIVIRGSCLETVTYTNIVANTREYPLPSDFLQIVRVAFATDTSSQSVKWLEGYDIYSMDSFSEVWDSTTTGTPNKYYVTKSTINLIPIPSTSITNGLKIQYKYKPADLSSDTGIPFDNQSKLYPYHMLIVFRVVHLCFLDLKMYNEANLYEQKYYEGLNMMTQHLRLKPDIIPTYGTIGGQPTK